jgi:hypothetical protein
VVFALNVTAIVVMALAHYETAELVRLGGLLLTVAIGTLAAARRPRNPMGWLMLCPAHWSPGSSWACASASSRSRLTCWVSPRRSP